MYQTSWCLNLKLVCFLLIEISLKKTQLTQGVGMNAIIAGRGLV